MTFLYYLILLLHIAACLFLIAVVLLQQGKGQDLASAFGGGGTQTAFGPRGSATVLSRATAILAGLFMVTSLGLSLIKPRSAGILDRVPAATTAPKPSATAPPRPLTPLPTPTNAGAPAEAAPKPGPTASPSGK